MQQKLCSRGSRSFLLERNGQACGAVSVSSCNLLFHCPRCGEQERFRSLASLRAHLEYHHSYQSPDMGARGFSITGKPPDPLTAAVIPWHDPWLLTNRGRQSAARPLHARSLSDSRDGSFFQAYGCVRRRTQSVGVGTQPEDVWEKGGGSEDEEGEKEEEERDGGEKTNGGRDEEKVMKDGGCEHNHHHILFPPPAPIGPLLDPELDLDLADADTSDTWCLSETISADYNSFSGLETASVAVRRRLASILRAADSTMQQRLAKVNTELARTDTELLCERAHSQHLAQEKQEVAERERSLSRQVDVAVMVIAAMREQLNASENELEQREREVITIQRFLAAAVRQETCGKVRIQRFIENLLRRIALAERLLEYYQGNGSPLRRSDRQHQQPAANGPHKITKSKSAAGPLSSSGFHNNRTHSSSRFGARPLSSKLDGERDQEHRECLAQSSWLFCRPEQRSDIWNRQRHRSAGYEA